MNQIPDEILEMVFSYLDGRNLGRCCCVCHRWWDVANRRKVWKNIMDRPQMKGEVLWPMSNVSGIGCIEKQCFKRWDRTIRNVAKGKFKKAIIPDVYLIEPIGRFGLAVILCNGSVRVYDTANEGSRPQELMKLRFEQEKNTTLEGGVDSTLLLVNVCLTSGRYIKTICFSLNEDIVTRMTFNLIGVVTLVQQGLKYIATRNPERAISNVSQNLKVQCQPIRKWKEIESNLILIQCNDQSEWPTLTILTVFSLDDNDTLFEVKLPFQISRQAVYFFNPKPVIVLQDEGDTSKLPPNQELDFWKELQQGTSNKWRLTTVKDSRLFRDFHLFRQLFLETSRRPVVKADIRVVTCSHRPNIEDLITHWLKLVNLEIEILVTRDAVSGCYLRGYSFFGPPTLLWNIRLEGVFRSFFIISPHYFASADGDTNSIFDVKTGTNIRSLELPEEKFLLLATSKYFCYKTDLNQSLFSRVVVTIF